MIFFIYSDVFQDEDSSSLFARASGRGENDDIPQTQSVVTVHVAGPPYPVHPRPLALLGASQERDHSLKALVVAGPRLLQIRSDHRSECRSYNCRNLAFQEVSRGYPRSRGSGALTMFGPT